MFSALWITAQLTVGPLIGQITQVHGVMQRLVGWLLMLILAELSGHFGRVSIMTAVAALATRMIRRSASMYVWVLGFGYALGGLTFDLLFFLPIAKNFEGKTRKGYLLTASIVSGLVVFVPYLLFKLYTLGTYAFLAFIPVYVYSIVKGTLLSVLGTLTSLSISSLFSPWRTKTRGKERATAF